MKTNIHIHTGARSHTHTHTHIFLLPLNIFIERSLLGCEILFSGSCMYKKEGNTNQGTYIYFKIRDLYIYITEV